MSFLPRFEPLFPLSDDLSNVEAVEVCERERGALDGSRVAHVPHGFLSVKGMDFLCKMPEFPTEGTH